MAPANSPTTKGTDSTQAQPRSRRRLFASGVTLRCASVPGSAVGLIRSPRAWLPMEATAREGGRVQTQSVQYRALDARSRGPLPAGAARRWPDHRLLRRRHDPGGLGQLLDRRLDPPAHRHVQLVPEAAANEHSEQLEGEAAAIDLEVMGHLAPIAAHGVEAIARDVVGLGPVAAHALQGEHLVGVEFTHLDGSIHLPPGDGLSLLTLRSELYVALGELLQLLEGVSPAADMLEVPASDDRKTQRRGPLDHDARINDNHRRTQ